MASNEQVQDVEVMKEDVEEVLELGELDSIEDAQSLLEKLKKIDTESIVEGRDRAEVEAVLSWQDQDELEYLTRRLEMSVGMHDSYDADGAVHLDT